MSHEQHDPQSSDSELAVATSRGDDDAFAALYGRYSARIEGYVGRMLGDPHLAEDVTHEVFVSALRRLRDDRPPIALAPWLYRIAHNAAIDVHRRGRFTRDVPLGAGHEELALRDGAPEDAAEVRQRLALLLGALDGLSETHRSVLVLRELEGLSNGQIAERLGISRAAVEALLFRARARVRREYEDLVSGRRCARVSVALETAGAGRRLGRRERELAARHLRGCRACRRAAWERGVDSLIIAETPAAAVAPLPALAAALVGRTHELARNLLVPWSVGPPAAAPWGRALAVVGVMALGAGTGGERAQPAAAAPHAVAPVFVAAPPPAPRRHPPHARVRAGSARRHAASRPRPRAVSVPPREATAVSPAYRPARRALPAAGAPEPRERARRESPQPEHRRPAEREEAALEPRVVVAVPAADASAAAGTTGASVRAAGQQADVGAPAPSGSGPDALPAV